MDNATSEPEANEPGVLPQGSSWGQGSLSQATAHAQALLSDVSFPLETVDAEKARETQRHALHQITDYVQPRLQNEQAPVLVVVGGSTGSGKSTLINSLLSERVTLPGALRPTTRNPVLVHNPRDAQWFDSLRILPTLAREVGTRGKDLTGAIPAALSAPSARAGDAADALASNTLPSNTLPTTPVPPVSPDLPDAPASPSSPVANRGTQELRVVPSDSVPSGLALIDSPDVDSMVDSNRQLAQQLLAAADLWLFVTTAARYADAVPWDTLRSAVARDTEVAIVIDRVDPGAMDVVTDLRSMLDAHGLHESPLFVIEEQELQDGLIPAPATAHIAQWLTWLMVAPGERDRVVAGTRNGAVESLARTIEELAVHVETQLRAQKTLVDIADGAYAHAYESVRAATSDGTLLRGEVLRRWQDYVGTGELMRGVEEKIAALRDRVSAYVRGKSAAPKVQQAVGDTLYAVVKDACDRAAEETYRGWFAHPAGKSFAANTSLATSSGNLHDLLSQEIRGWQAGILELISETGAEKRTKARALAFGTNGLGVALMIVAFASTGGLTGVEAGIAGGTGIAAQKLLESVFGEDAVRKLARDAQADLERRMLAVIEQEKLRYVRPLEVLGLSQEQGTALRRSARQLHAGVASLVQSPRKASTRADSDELPESRFQDRDKVSQAAKWFGGAGDAYLASQDSVESYAGAILYGTAGIGSPASASPLSNTTQAANGSRSNSESAEEPGRASRAPTWWKKLFGGQRQDNEQ